MEPVHLFMAGAVTAQAATVVAAVLLRKQRRTREDLYRLSAWIQCLLTGALVGAGNWWAVATAAAAATLAWAAATEPERRARPLPIHADRNTR